MPRTCILTDSTVLFPKPIYPGHEHVHVIPHHVIINGQDFPDKKDLDLLKSPPAAERAYPQAQPPTVEQFRQVFTSLGAHYQEIIAILISSHLSQAVNNASQAAQILKTHLPVHIIDSQTTAAGLGMLVQAAAENLHRGVPGRDVNRIVRGLTRQIYAVFCLPDLIYLSHSGQLDLAQAVAGEMLGLIPFFVLENGRLSHVQKIRSPKNIVDLMYEFITEFEGLRYLALIQGLPAFEPEYRSLSDRVRQNLRATYISEHTLSLALATILGPRTIGLVTMQNTAGNLS